MGEPSRASSSSAGMCHTDRRTPEDTSRSTIRASAGLETAIRQSGQRNEYEPWLLVEHTWTVTSRVVSSTSPHVGQLALMVAIRGLPFQPYSQSIGQMGSAVKGSEQSSPAKSPDLV